MEGGRVEGTGPVDPGSYSAYIFDLDGTLFSIPVDWSKVREEVGKVVGSAVGELPLFLKVEQSVSVRPSLREPLFALLDSHELKALPSATLMDGASDLLLHLSKEAALGMVTMQGSAACDRLLGKYRLGEFFDTIVTREDSLDRTAQLRFALKTLGSSPSETLFVGDRLNDVQCGKKAGMRTALLRRDPPVGVDAPDYSFPTLALLRDAILGAARVGDT